VTSVPATVPPEIDRLMGAVLLAPGDGLARLALADAAEEAGLYDDCTREVLRTPGGWWRALYEPSDGCPGKDHQVRYVVPATLEERLRLMPPSRRRGELHFEGRRYRLGPEPRPHTAPVAATGPLFRTSVRCRLHAAGRALGKSRSPSYHLPDRYSAFWTPFTRGAWACESCHGKDCRERRKGRPGLYELAGGEG
jgi:hypothetical protein